MKTCSKCQATKNDSDFFVRDRSTGQLHAQCKFCYQLQRQIHYADHYQKYKKNYLARAKERREKLKREFRTKMFAFLSDQACAVCGEHDIRVLELDHIDPTKKKFTISQAVRLGFAWDEVLQEIAKCQILCANCHRKRTAEQYGWYKN